MKEDKNNKIITIIVFVALFSVLFFLIFNNLRKNKFVAAEKEPINPKYVLPFEDINVFVAEYEIKGVSQSSYTDVYAYLFTNNNEKVYMIDFPDYFFPPLGVSYDSPQFFVFPAKNQVLPNIQTLVWENNQLIDILYEPVNLVWYGSRIYVYEKDILLFDFRPGVDYYTFTYRVASENIQDNYINGYEDGQVDLYVTGSLYNGFNEDGSFDYNNGYDNGFDLGLTAGDTGSATTSIFSVVISAIAGGLGLVLGFELIPGFTIGLFVMIPLLFGLLFFIIRGRGD